MKTYPMNDDLTLFTKNEIIIALRDRYRSYNMGSKKPILVNGLTIEQHEHIGNLLLAMKDLETQTVEI